MEIRKIWTSTTINDYVDFPYCGQVACLKRYREEIKSGKIQNETVYLITSLSQDDADGQRLLSLIRGHWGIENKSHYVRDVTFDEDRSKVRKKNGPEIMANLRNLCIGIMRLKGIKNIAQGTRDFMLNPKLAIELIGY